MNYQNHELYNSLLNDLKDQLEFTTLSPGEAGIKYMSLILSTWCLLTIPLESSFTHKIRKKEEKMKKKNLRMCRKIFTYFKR